MVGYFLAFTKPVDLKRQKFAFACRPSGGPFLMGSLVNVYGDACGLFRTEALRAAGGFDEPQDGHRVSDWPIYVKLARLGHAVGVVPDYLLYYHSRTGALARWAECRRTHQRVLEEYVRAQDLTETERVELWTALISFYQRRTAQIERLQRLNLPLRYRMVDLANTFLKKLPWIHPLGRAVVDTGLNAWKQLRRSKKPRQLTVVAPKEVSQ